MESFMNTFKEAVKKYTKRYTEVAHFNFENFPNPATAPRK